MANLVAVRSAIRALRATLTASRADCRSTAAGLSAADLARAARSSWAFFAFAAALRRSAKPVFFGQFFSILYAQGKKRPQGGWRFLIKSSRLRGPAIRKLFDWLIIGQTLAVNPAHADALSCDTATRRYSPEE